MYCPKCDKETPENELNAYHSCEECWLKHVQYFLWSRSDSQGYRLPTKGKRQKADKTWIPAESIGSVSRKED